MPSSEMAVLEFLNSQSWWVWSSEQRRTGTTDPVEGKLYKTSNGEQAWAARGNGVDWQSLPIFDNGTLRQSLQDGYNVVQLDFVTEQVGWALLNTDNGSKPALLLKTLDGGQSWELLNTTVQGERVAAQGYWEAVSGEPQVSGQTRGYLLLQLVRD